MKIFKVAVLGKIAGALLLQPVRRKPQFFPDLLLSFHNFPMALSNHGVHILRGAPEVKSKHNRRAAKHGNLARHPPFPEELAQPRKRLVQF